MKKLDRMTQEDKQLLLKDLCARLPYETRVRYIYAFAGAVGISRYSDEGILSYDKLQDFSLPNVGYEKRRVDNILPYLRPMSSMTEKEYETFPIPYSFDSFSTWNNTILSEVIEGTQILIGIDEITEIIDWLNAHYFDYRGLIEKGLALEAPEGMYKIN